MNDWQIADIIVLGMFATLGGGCWFFYRQCRPVSSLSTASKVNGAVRFLGFVLAFYIGIYAVLMLNGGYYFTQSGEVRYDFGLSVSDLSQWQPRFAFCQRFRQLDGTRTLRANNLGYIFAPLILLDQDFVHPTVRLIDPKTGRWLKG